MCDEYVHRLWYVIFIDIDVRMSVEYIVRKKVRYPTVRTFIIFSTMTLNNMPGTRERNESLTPLVIHSCTTFLCALNVIVCAASFTFSTTQSIGRPVK